MASVACGLVLVIGGLATLLAWTDRLRCGVGIAAMTLALTVASSSFFVWRSQTAVEDALRPAIEQNSGQVPTEKQVETITDQLERLEVSVGPRYGVFLAGTGAILALGGGVMTTRIRCRQRAAAPVAAPI